MAGHGRAYFFFFVAKKVCPRHLGAVLLQFCQRHFYRHMRHRRHHVYIHIVTAARTPFFLTPVGRAHVHRIRYAHTRVSGILHEVKIRCCVFRDELYVASITRGFGQARDCCTTYDEELLSSVMFSSSTKGKWLARRGRRAGPDWLGGVHRFWKHGGHHDWPQCP